MNVVSEKIRACFTILPADISELQSEFNHLCQSGMITCFADYSKELESRLRKLLEVKHALAISNGTAALQILLATLPAGSEVLVPSYTFPSTIHAVVLAGHRPRFIDVDRATYNICLPEDESQINKATAILAVNTFGNPCQIAELDQFAKTHGLKLFFDSAAAIGAKYRSHYLGAFGDAEVFSLSGTKVVTGGEGGVITTNDDELAEKLNCLRNYGYCKRAKDCLYIGINGKMSEPNAIFALWSLDQMQKEIAARQKIAEVYYERLQKLPGIDFQKILKETETNFCTFAITIEPQEFGLTAPQVLEHLRAEGIETLRYFCPPMHQTQAYQAYNHIRLVNSETLSQQNLCLPMHSKLTATQAQRVCTALENSHAGAEKIRQTRAAVSSNLL